MSDSTRFYDKLKPFWDFADVVVPEHYTRAPEDWNVVISDVKGSTRAIAENRYKEVNMAGAATITTVLNTLANRKIPFVFGGDGATFLVHDDDIAKVGEALRKTSAMVTKAYDLELRIGIVPIAELSKAGAFVEVAKFQVSGQSTLAMIRGGGVAVAEKWIKDHDPRATVLTPAEGVADVAGLSCRWNPIRSKRGEMLSILVLARGQGEAGAKIYENVIHDMESIFGPGDQSHPVTISKLDSGVSLKTMLPEFKLKMKAAEEGFLYAVKILLGTLGLRLLYKFGLRIAGFDARAYVRGMVSNTDFRKFDDMLRMVRECDAGQRAALEEYLEAKYQEGLLYYGLHASKEALMTCMVFTVEDHLHFIDGSGGGYAMAAKQLKAQMASPREANLSL